MNMIDSGEDVAIVDLRNALELESDGRVLPSAIWIDPATLEFIDQTFHVPACSMYGTTEIGVILVNYPGSPDFPVKPGSLGKPIPGGKVEVHDANGVSRKTGR